MTPKQTLRLIKKIADIKQALAAEKRKYGGYDDSRGLRYLPTRYFLQLGDYKGGLAYTCWFAKAFPDDVGFPDFLFEWTVLLVKVGKFAEAEQKAWQTFCANTYVFDKFLGHQVQPLDKYEWSNYAKPLFTDYFIYSHEQTDLVEFSEWLEKFVASELFKSSQSYYLTIYQRLLTESDHETRSYLLKEAALLENRFSA